MPRLVLHRALTIAVLLFATLPAAAAAEDVVVESFDGTPIVAAWYPAPGAGLGSEAPTVLVGHGWGGSRSPSGSPFTEAGYNVLSWDARGFGQSGGTVMADSPDFEGRDVQSLVDWVANRPEARLDAAGDPRVGMSGSSYGGIIQLVSAAIDHRIDAILPDIAWHSPVSVFYKDGAVKAGWVAALCGLGVPTAYGLGMLPGGPAGVQTGGLDPHITNACAEGLGLGEFSQENIDWFSERGGDELYGRVRAPALITQGTVDTLTTLYEGLQIHRVLSANGVPVKMMWFCGGHGTCSTGTGAPGHVRAAQLAWLARYLKGDDAVDTGPGFEWLDDTATWHSAPAWPVPAGVPLTGAASGTLPLSPADHAASGNPLGATPGVNSVRIPIEAPAGDADVVGEPRVRMTYSGTAVPAATHLYAQIVDVAANRVAGNQVTPIAVTLDGGEYTLERALEPISLRATPASEYVLEIIPSTQVYEPQKSAGTVELSHVSVELPVATPGCDGVRRAPAGHLKGPGCRPRAGR